MDLRQLSTFRTVANSLSFTRAAASLNYAQSSVTAQIQTLEEQLGVPLFDRLGKRVVLTDAGRRLLPYAERLLNLADEARIAASGSEIPSGTLIISAPETLCTYRLPDLLHTFRERYPDVRLVMRPTAAGDLRRCVVDGTLDVAFVLDEPIEAIGLVTEQLVVEPILLLATTGHPLAGTSCVHPVDLKDEPMLLTEVGCSYRGLFERTLAADGIYLDNVLEFSSVEAIKQCVKAGMGITVLPAVAATAEVAQGQLAVLRWSAPNFQIVTQLVYHRNKWLSPTLRTFLEVSRELVR